MDLETILNDFFIKDICCMILDYVLFTYYPEEKYTLECMFNHDITYSIINDSLYSYCPHNDTITLNNIEAVKSFSQSDQISVYKNNIYVLHGDKILVFDNNFKKISTMNLTSYSGGPLVVMDDKIYIFSLALINSFTILDMQGTIIRDIAVEARIHKVQTMNNKLYTLNKFSIVEYLCNGDYVYSLGLPYKITDFCIFDEEFHIFTDKCINVYTWHDKMCIGTYTIPTNGYIHNTNNSIYVCTYNYPSTYTITKYIIRKKCYTDLRRSRLSFASKHLDTLKN